MCQKSQNRNPIPNVVTPELVIQALNTTPFDAESAHRLVEPRPRIRTRPPDLPGNPHIGAVMVVLHVLWGATCVVMIRRQNHLRYHPGQISFPGGRCHEHENPQEAALRETQEEIGIDRSLLKLLGRLCPIYVPPSDFLVHPFAAWLHAHPVFHRDPSEVADIFSLPLTAFDMPSARSSEVRNINGREVLVPYFIVSGRKIWGTTAMIMSELLERIRAACS